MHVPAHTSRNHHRIHHARVLRGIEDSPCPILELANDTVEALPSLASTKVAEHAVVGVAPCAPGLVDGAGQHKPVLVLGSVVVVFHVLDPARELEAWSDKRRGHGMRRKRGGHVSFKHVRIHGL